MADTAINVVTGKRLDGAEARPESIPEHATWANGLWYVGGQPWNRVISKPTPVGEQKALHAAEYEKQQVQLREGLPAGQYRHGGLIYGRDAKSIGPDDQSWRPGHAERREARIEGIKEASEAQQDAITALERATQRKLEADAKFAKSYETKEA